MTAARVARPYLTMLVCEGAVLPASRVGRSTAALVAVLRGA